jgi:hypothetical protein
LDANDNMSTIASGFSVPSAVAVGPDGSIFVTDTSGTLGSVVRRITPTGSVSVIAGIAGTAGTTDGTGTVAKFTSPTGITVDGGGTIFVSEVLTGATGAIRKIAFVSGDPSMAANYTVSTPLSTGLTNPYNIAIDTNGQIYSVNGTSVALVSRAGGVMSANTSWATGFTNAQGVAVDTAHNVYVTDANQVKRVPPGGGSTITTIAGSTTGGFVDSAIGTPALFNLPEGISVEAGGTLLVVDYNSYAIREVQRVVNQ